MAAQSYNAVLSFKCLDSQFQPGVTGYVAWFKNTRVLTGAVRPSRQVGLFAGADWFHGLLEASFTAAVYHPAEVRHVKVRAAGL